MYFTPQSASTLWKQFHLEENDHLSFYNLSHFGRSKAPPAKISHLSVLSMLSQRVLIHPSILIDINVRLCHTYTIYIYYVLRNMPNIQSPSANAASGNQPKCRTWVPHQKSLQPLLPETPLPQSHAGAPRLSPLSGRAAMVFWRYALQPSDFSG